jgi:hypothetical protein
MKPRTVTVIEVTITHEKPIEALTDLVANRAYSVDGVVDCTAKLVSQVRVEQTTEGV